MNTRSAILSKLHIDSLNEMQRQTAEAVANTDKDVLVLSPTGTGKTLAYLLPLAERLLATQSSVSSPPLTAECSPRAVVVVPGRELAQQSAGVLQSMGCGLRAMALYGGRPTMDEHREMRKIRPQVLFATPGRMNDHLDKGNVVVGHLNWLVIDEFDKCLEMGFQDEMSRLVASLPNIERRILLSATQVEAIPRFVNMGHLVSIDFRQQDDHPTERITFYQIACPDKDKITTLLPLLHQLGQQSSVVFLNHRESVERVGVLLTEAGFTVGCFHGGLDQQQRERALYRFANGSANVLVATDLASRGLDIPSIDNIIHYHLPETQQNYTHRIGRTARWDRNGRTFFLLSSAEQLPDYVSGEVVPYAVPTTSGGSGHSAAPVPKMATLYIGKGRKDKLSKGDIVGFLCKKGGLTSADIGLITIADRYTSVAVLRHKAAAVLQRVQGEKIKGQKTLVELKSK